MPASPARSGQIRLATLLGRAVLIALPLAAVLGAVFLYNARTQGELLRREMAAEARRDLDAQHAMLVGTFEQAMRDVLLLGDAERLQDFLDAPTPRNVVRAGELLFLMVQRKGYDQVRFLDANGQERVRANFNAGSPAIVLDADLQPKGDRYYVREAMALDRGSIYISPLDLNQEHGHIEVPLKPTVRICTPAFDRLGRKRGVLAVNLLARDMLEALGQGERESGRQIMLLGRDGYWLKAPDPDLEWGFLIPERRERTFGRAYPRAWAAMQGAEEGMATTPDGLFVFESVRLDGEAQQWPNGPRFQVRQGNGEGGGNRWRLVAFMPQDEVDARTQALRQGSLVLFGLCVAALLLASGVLALNLERRRAIAEGLARAEEQARSLSTDLQGVLDASTEVAIIATDTAGLITTFNAGAERMLGYSAAEMVGKQTPQAFHLKSEIVRRGEELSRELGRPVQGFDAFVALAREGRSDSREWTYMRKGGDLLTVQLTVTARHDSRGDLTGFLGVAVDVTERERAVEALRAGEERLRLFIRHTPAAVAMFDTDMRYIVASRRWKEDYGLGDQDLTGLSHYDVFPEISQEWKDIHQRVLAGETMRRDEDPFPRADGSKDYVRWENVPWLQDDGSIGGIVMFTEVVTERWKAREALRESQRRFMDLADLAPVGIFETDADGGCLFVNENWRMLAGLTAEQAAGQGWSGAIHPEDREKVAREWYAAAGEGREFQLEYRFLRPDGKVSWVIGAASAKRDEAGRVTGYFGSVLDITERRLAEDAVRLSQARLDAVVNTAVDGILTINTAGVIQTVNPAAARIFGYEPGEMVAQPVTMLMPEPYRSMHDEYLARYLATGDPHIIGRGGREVPGRRKDGEVIPLELSVSEVRVGEQWFFTGMLKDISERKRLEVELLAAKEQAEAASQAKSEFLARMSHEIRTPMNAVLGLTHLALQTRLDSRQHDYLAKVQTSARLLLGIINDILDFSKIEAGRLELETADFDLDEVLDGLLVVVGQAAEAKGLALAAAADPDVPRLLAGDALRLTQVLVNLMNNAVKFTEQGEVSLRVSRGEGGGPSVPLRLTVRDTGMGMDEAARARLFQSFSQADETITRRFGGTGLGLAISKRLVELMGGSITVESQPGQGSTFTVCVTLAPASGRTRASRGQAPDVAALAAIRGAAVLVAEDNAINRQVARELLTAAGMRVSEAENGLAAVAAVQAKSFDLALMDVHMPVMDGHEATRRIRALGEGGRLPIVAMSASAMTDDRDRSIAAGMDDHLPKPFTPEALARMLVKWIRPGVREPLPVAPADPPPLAAGLPPVTPALDTARGLASAGGKPELYRSLLAQFAEEFAQTPERLETAFAAGDRAGARLVAHSLRGVAGNLGAGGVEQAAAAMERALAEENVDQARAALPRLATALRQVLETVRLLDAGPGNGQEERLESPMDSGRTAACLDRLEELLARQDMDADTAAEELARLLAGSPLAGPARELAQAVARFAYGAAREGIAHLRKALGKLEVEG